MGWWPTLTHRVPSRQGIVVVKQFKRHWRELTKGRPGRRFQDRYKRDQETSHNKPLIRQSVQPLIGIILLAVGIVFCVIPGPGLPLVFLGAAVLSERCFTLARMMDWMEVKLRNVLARLKTWWRKASPVARNGAIVVLAAAIAGIGYGAFQIVFRH